MTDGRYRIEKGEKTGPLILKKILKFLKKKLNFEEKN
jgi:hypothetical protein